MSSFYILKCNVNASNDIEAQSLNATQMTAEYYQEKTGKNVPHEVIGGLWNLTFNDEYISLREKLVKEWKDGLYTYKNDENMKNLKEFCTKYKYSDTWLIWNKIVDAA